MSEEDGAAVPPSERLNQVLLGNERIEELSTTTSNQTQEYGASQAEQEFHDDDEDEGWVDTFSNVPGLFSQLPFLVDALETPTSIAQDKVAEACRKLLSGEEREIDQLNSHGIPRLLKEKHIKFMYKSLNTYPPPYQAMDASRPWILYWALAGLAHMGEDVTKFRERAVQTFTPLQNATGGFGGGHGQTSHGAATYAAILALALVGGLHMVDRRAMWQWLGSIKQSSGAFAMAVDGEVDVRGAYCSMTVIALLNLPLELPHDAPARATGLVSFTDRLGEWVGSCQTYEGGIGSSPGNEAHGAYAFCGLACLSLLDAPHVSIPRYLNVDKLVARLGSQQYAPEGGFAGRTNKLVDACYSHWVGGCWSLLEAAVQGGEGGAHAPLWNREALVRYTLCCSQTKAGGLRDKPGTRQDGYHTCYSLAGLSAAQNHWSWAGGDRNEQSSALEAAFEWRPRRASEIERQEWAFDEEDAVGFVHPVFVMPPEVVARTKKQFHGVTGL